MPEYLIQGETLTGIADAIRAKTGESGQMTPLEMPEKIASIQTGGGGGTAVSAADINFYDYDGMLVAAWTLEELAGKTALPDNPSHPGLTAQGWNWTLENLKAANRPMNVGQMYITDDGKTRLYITIAAPGRQDVPLYTSQSIANGVTIDWGDGSAAETLPGTGNVHTVHHYADIGSYRITLSPASGCELGLGSNSPSACVMGDTGNNGRVYCNMLQKVEIGSGVASIGIGAFYNCYSLASVTIPEGVTSIGIGAFSSCYSLASVTIPEGVTSIGSGAFSSCYSLASVTIPEGVTSIGGSAFSHCYSLASVTIPEGVTSIGDDAFSSCYSLASVTIPESVTSIGTDAFSSCYSLASVTIPESVTSIGTDAFYNCYSLASVTIPESVTSIGSSAFSHCYSLASVTIPESVTSIGTDAFYSCYSLASVTIPESVTSIGTDAFYSCYSLASVTIPEGVTSIGSSAFRSCYSLASVTIPEGVTSIGSSAFSSCYGMAEYHLLAAEPPTLSSSTAFNNIPDDCVIYVPQGALAAYQSATNWSTYANHMQEEPQ